MQFYIVIHMMALTHQGRVLERCFNNSGPFKANINGAPILRFTMATNNKRGLRIVIIIEHLSFGEYEHIFRRKSNTAAEAKEREV